MIRFSANLGLLFTEYDLPEAIHTAHKAGFDAVECHWPYAYASAVIKSALDETGLQMLGINTARGDAGKGEFGLSALPDRTRDARAAIDQAIDYARAIDCPRIHVMAGNCRDPQSQDVMIENLHYAAGKAPDLTLMIEPINTIDLPDYALTSIEQATEIINTVAADNVKLMFDCYHIGKMGGDVISLLKTHMPLIAHIQFASVPDRGPPDLSPSNQGTLDYNAVFKTISDLGYQDPLGAEYRPDAYTQDSHTKDSLDWLRLARP